MARESTDTEMGTPLLVRKYGIPIRCPYCVLNGSKATRCECDYLRTLTNEIGRGNATG